MIPKTHEVLAQFFSSVLVLADRYLAARSQVLASQAALNEAKTVGQHAENRCAAAQAEMMELRLAHERLTGTAPSRPIHPVTSQ